MISSILLAVLLIGGSFGAPIDSTSDSDTHLTSTKMTNPIGSDYRFIYSVYDENTGDMKSHRESRRDDVVEGRYELIEPDGFKRIVIYTADAEHGFVATVLREPTDIVVPIYESRHYKPSLREKPIRVASNVEFNLSENDKTVVSAVPKVEVSVGTSGSQPDTSGPEVEKPVDSATSADSSKTDNLEIQEMASSENLNPQLLQAVQNDTVSSEADSTEKNFSTNVTENQEVQSTTTQEDPAEEKEATTTAMPDDTTFGTVEKEVTPTTVVVEENKTEASVGEPEITRESSVNSTSSNFPSQVLLEVASSTEADNEIRTSSEENVSKTVTEASVLSKESQVKNTSDETVTSGETDSVITTEVPETAKDVTAESESQPENDSQTATSAPEATKEVEAESGSEVTASSDDSQTTAKEAETTTDDSGENSTTVASEQEVLTSEVVDESNKRETESSVVDTTGSTTPPFESNELNNTEKVEVVASTTTENPPSPTSSNEESSTEQNTTPRETSSAKQIEDIVTPATDPAAVATVVMEILKETKEKNSEESFKLASELPKRRRHISPRFRLKF